MFGLCILLRVYQLNIGITSVHYKVFLLLDIIADFSHYMFRPRLAAIFRWFANTKKNLRQSQEKHQTHPQKAIHDALRRRQILLTFNYRNKIVYFYILKFAVIILFYILPNHDRKFIHTYSTDPLNI
jgi:hypothetical protein